jgi:regulatory protein
LGIFYKGEIILYTVTHLERLKNKKYSVIIKSEEQTVNFEISEDLLIEFRVVMGKVLSKSDFKKFVVANDRDIVYQKVLHYALYKMRCTKEVKDYLTKKKIPFEEQPYYLNKLTRSRILDDLKYADIFVRESIEFKKIGPDKIIYELEKKKIDKNTYQQFIERIKSSEIDENLDYLFHKKLHSMKNKSIKIAMQNIKQFLITKGYNYEVVSHFVEKSIEEIKSTINEDAILEKDYLIAKKKYSTSKNSRTNTISYLLRKGYDYQKIKAIIGDNSYEQND